MYGGSIQNNQVVQSTNSGGGLVSSNSASLYGVSITGNSVQGNGGGVDVGWGTTTCTDCTITGNTAVGLGSGGSWKANNGTLTLNNCTTNGTFVPTP